MRLVLALSALSLVSMAAAVWGWLRPSPPAPVLRYELALDSTASLLNTGRWGRIALSRDGSMFVYVGGPRNGLILRRRDQLAGSPIPGTDQAGAPEFSPDGKRVAFIQGASRLMITSLDGSPPALVTDTLLGLGGIAWAGNDTLYVDGRGPTPLVKVAARVRSRPEYIAPFDSSLGEVDQYWPEVLPGGALLYTISRGGLPHAIAILDPRSGARRVLIEGARRPRYANGYLFYVTIDGALMAVPFDHRGQIMKGDPVVVGAGLATAPLALDVTVSGNALAFVVGPTGGTELELIWVSRNGRVEVFDSTWRAPFADPAISPDGSRLAISDGITTGLGDVSNIWIRPMTSGGRMRLSAPRGRNRFPVWTRDGKHVLYSSSQDSIAMIMENPADGSIAATPRIAYREAGIGVVTATPDGEWIVFTRGLARGSRLHVHRRGDTAATRLIAEESPQSSPAFSPDGRFLAFVGSDDGVSKVYVSPFPNPANERWLVSPTFGNEPVWSNKGNELFYRDVSANTLVAVPVNTVGRFSLGAPQVLFSVPGTARFAVSRDDSRFLMVRPVGASMASRDRLTMVENWVEGLRPTVRP